MMPNMVFISILFIYVFIILFSSICNIFSLHLYERMTTTEGQFCYKCSQYEKKTKNFFLSSQIERYEYLHFFLHVRFDVRQTV